MQELLVTKKSEYLRKNYPFSPTPKLSAKMRCIHCETEFTVKDYKVFKDKHGEEYISCPNAPECDGTVIDWFDIEK